MFGRYSDSTFVWVASEELQQSLARQQIRAKERTDEKGNKTGGGGFSRGALYQLLKNHLYIGQIHYRGEYYQGQHERSLTARRGMGWRKPWVRTGAPPGLE